MIFSNVNLVDTAAATRLVRQMVSQTLPNAQALTDREQILQALELAAADLDAADPLLLPVAIDATPYIGQDSPIIPNVGNQFIGTRITALYMPAAIQPENLIPFANGETASAIIPQAVITADLLALVQWPRHFSTAILSAYNGKLFTITNIATANVALSGSGTGPDMDGQTPDNYGHCLLIAQTNPAQNGVYEFYTNGVTYTLTRPASPQWDWAHQGSAFYIENGSTQAHAYYQLTTPDPIVVDATALSFAALTTYDTNIDTSECSVYLVPRAAGYLVQSSAIGERDKNVSAALTAWASAMLARPLPVMTQAASQRIQSVTRYSNT